MIATSHYFYMYTLTLLASAGGNLVCVVFCLCAWWEGESYTQMLLYTAESAQAPYQQIASCYNFSILAQAVEEWWYGPRLLLIFIQLVLCAWAELSKVWFYILQTKFLIFQQSQNNFLLEFPVNYRRFYVPVSSFPAIHRNNQRHYLPYRNL